MRQLLLDGVQAGLYPDDIPIEAMTQVLAGMITHAGITLAEASTRRRKAVRRDLQTAIGQIMLRLRRPDPPALAAIHART